jgi:hypothetical protein
MQLPTLASRCTATARFTNKPPSRVATAAYSQPAAPIAGSSSEAGTSTAEYPRIWRCVSLSPETTGSMGTPAAAYSSLRHSARAQKWGGVHRKMISDITQAATLMVPVTAAQAIRGAVAPAAPPMTMFCGVMRFSQAV